MEADLARYYQTDIRDRWRTDEHGRPRLTLRMIAVRIRHLPPDSATATALNDGEQVWARRDVLTADLYNALTGKEHPLLADARRSAEKKPDSAWSRAIAAAKARINERKRKIEAGEIT